MQGEWLLMDEGKPSLLVFLNWQGEINWPQTIEDQQRLAHAEGYPHIQGFRNRLKQLYRTQGVRFLEGQRTLHLHSITIRKDFEGNSEE